MGLSSGFVVAGVACAGVAGYAAWGVYEALRRRMRHRSGVRGQPAAQGAGGKVRGMHPAGSFEDRVIAYVESESRAISLGHGVRVVPESLARSAWLERHAVAAGVGGSITVEGFCEARVRLALLGSVAGAFAGGLFSGLLAMLAGACGLAAGWRCTGWALRQRTQRRARDMEQRLPEMLDVVALGMRSGLSFERSLALYVQHFDTLLAQSFALAQRQWSCGFERRDTALRNMAASYDSVLFERAVEGMVRSLRFGSSMIEGLEATAAEARAGYRAYCQERVAKAPVKMMVPTGVLILPAMLMLVLGPVLLELTGGFA